MMTLNNPLTAGGRSAPPGQPLEAGCDVRGGDLYLDEGDAIGRHGDVVAELVEELRRNSQGGAAELKLIRPGTETHA